MRGVPFIPMLSSLELWEKSQWDPEMEAEGTLVPRGLTINKCWATKSRILMAPNAVDHLSSILNSLPHVVNCP